jgi:hypothetical protein
MTSEVAADGEPAEPHRAAPRQPGGDEIAAAVGHHAALVGIAPHGVVAQVAARRSVAAAAERLAVDAVGRDRAPAIEQPLLGPHRAVGGTPIDAADVDVVIEHATEAGDRRGTGREPPADRLLRQPLGRHRQLQLLGVAVVLAAHVGKLARIDQGARGPVQRNRHRLQLLGGHEEMAVAVFDGHDPARRQVVHDQLEEEGGRRQRRSAQFGQLWFRHGVRGVAADAGHEQRRHPTNGRGGGQRHVIAPSTAARW